MKITVHCEGTAAEVASELRNVAETLESERSPLSVSDLKPGKRGRPAKVKPEETEEEETEIEDEEDDAGESDEDEESEDETEEESEDEEEESEEGLSEKDLVKLKGALKAYSAKHGKEKAVKLLNKYAKTSQEVKPSDLAKLLKLLKV
jgi:uncharacterized protein with von Willebrand factor type A (vWA) domain